MQRYEKLEKIGEGMELKVIELDFVVYLCFFRYLWYCVQSEK